MRDLRNALLVEKQDVILDFTKTVQCQATGMIALMAELDRALRISGHRRIVRCRLPGRDTQAGKIVGQVLDQIGLLQLINQDPPPEHADERFHHTVSSWQYATGVRIDEKPGDILESVEGRISPALLDKMQKGLAEAITNSLHHAYRQPRMDGCPPMTERRWWMFTHEFEGMLSVLVCDLGIGIPRSLPLSWPRQILALVKEHFAGNAPDVIAIKTALLLGETSTNQSNRGRGLPQVWQATQEAEGGSVGIYSDRAYVGFTPEKKSINNDYRDRFLGTLVWWRVPIEAPVTDGSDSD